MNCAITDIISFVIALLCLAVNPYAQISAPYIQHLETVNGIALKPTGDPVQDELGILWIPTDDGILRYDGYELREFLTAGDDSSDVGIKGTRQLYMGSDSRIYITSSFRGFGIFDPRTGTFDLSSPSVADTAAFLLRNIEYMLEGEKGSWWFSSTGFHRWHADSGIIRSYYPSELLGVSGKTAEKYDQIKNIVQDPGNARFLWLTTPLALLRFDKRKEKLTSFPVSADTEAGVVHSPPDLNFGKDGKLYMGTWYDGLHIFDTTEKSWDVKYVSGEKDTFGLNNKIELIQQKTKDELWILAPWRGLFTYHTVTGQFRLTIPTENVSGQPESSHYHLRGNPLGLVQTADGTLWLRRYPQGIEIVSPGPQEFEKILTGSGVRNVIGKPGSGIIHILGEGSLHVYDQSSSSLEKYPVTEKGTRNILFDGAFSADEKLWMLGLNTLYQKSGNSVVPVTVHPFDSLQFAPSMHDNGHAWQFLIDSKDNFWIPLKRRGILKINTRNRQYQLYPISSENYGKTYQWEFPNDIIETATEAIWIAFQHGVCYTPDFGNTWMQYSFTAANEKNLEFRQISSLETDYQGRIWMGSKINGLFYTEYDNLHPQQLQVLTEKEGLISRGILDLELDHSGHLWMITDKGLSRMDTRDLTFRHFGSDFGLYGLSSLNLLPTGQMAIAASDGFYLFHPDSISEDTTEYLPVIHDLRIFGKTFKSTYTTPYLSEIALKHNQNFFTFEFSSPNFIAPEKIEYQYQLTGVDRDWVDAGVYRFANYTNISPGRYTFRVRASDMQGRWSDAHTSVALVIAPPWWLTSWAYALYISLVLAILGGIYWYQRRRWLLKTQLQIEQERANQLSELDRFKTRFYTNITHEFRTPLTVIKGLNHEIRGHDKIKSVIKRNTDRLLTMVNQLLDLSRMESDQHRVNWKQGDIIPYLEYLTESCHSLALRKQLSLSFFSKDEEVVMDFDESMLEDILINLVSNAIKFTPRYGRVKVVTERTVDQGIQKLQIAVKDTGQGIPEDKLHHIFDRFYQVDSSPVRDGEGSGIGLAIVKELVRLLDGSIEVRSEEGRGTTFIVTLPIHNEAEMIEAMAKQGVEMPPVIPEPNGDPASSAAVSDGKPIVLVIEDNLDVIDYIHRCLDKNFAVLKARNGRQGLDVAFDRIPDVIISDVMMPQMDGFEVCSTLKTDRRTSHIPVILLTARATQEDKLTGLSGGADAYLTKPFDKHELLVRLDNLTALSRRLRENLTAREPVNDPAAQRESEFLEELHGIIHTNLADESFDTHQLCRAIAMSRTQLHRKLKALTGASTANYIRMIRLEAARSLLLSTDLPVGEIAVQVGFKDFSHFSRSFSKMYGHTPSQERAFQA